MSGIKRNYNLSNNPAAQARIAANPEIQARIAANKRTAQARIAANPEIQARIATYPKGKAKQVAKLRIKSERHIAKLRR